MFNWPTENKNSIAAEISTKHRYIDFSNITSIRKTAMFIRNNIRINKRFPSRGYTYFQGMVILVKARDLLRKRNPSDLRIHALNQEIYKSKKMLLRTHGRITAGRPASPELTQFKPNDLSAHIQGPSPLLLS